MSMKDFHAKLVAAADQTPLFAALRKMTQMHDIHKPMAQGSEWVIWGSMPDPTPVPDPVGA